MNSKAHRNQQDDAKQNLTWSETKSETDDIERGAGGGGYTPEEGTILEKLANSDDLLQGDDSVEQL